MSFKAKLTLGSKKFDVLHCSYSLRRDVDAKGRPSSGVYGGTIQFEIESTDDVSIIESMTNNQHKAIKGDVVFMQRESTAEMKKLQFEDAYVIQYSEALDSVGSNPMTINFVLSARKLVLGNAQHENEWPK